MVQGQGKKGGALAKTSKAAKDRKDSGKIKKGRRVIAPKRNTAVQETSNRKKEEAEHKKHVESIMASRVVGAGGKLHTVSNPQTQPEAKK